MKFEKEIENTQKAFFVTTLLAKYFGNRRIEYDDFGNEVVISTLFNKDYFIDYTSGEIIDDN